MIALRLRTVLTPTHRNITPPRAETVERSVSYAKPGFGIGQSRGLDGYRADFVLARQSGTAEYTTTLCEVNDGYVSGRYDDFAVADFTDMIVARFAGLQASRIRPG